MTTQTKIAEHTPTLLVQNSQKAWKSILIAHLLRCLSDRSYSFFIPLYLSHECSNNGTTGLKPIAAMSMVQNITVALLGPFVANIYRNYFRSHEGEKKAFVVAIFLENGAVITGALCLRAFIGYEYDDGISSGGGDVRTNDLCDQPLTSIYFILALLFGAVDAIFSSLLSMIISKEWVAVLFHMHDKKSDGSRAASSSSQDVSPELAGANATLSQIDLAVATASPLVVSFAIRNTGGYDYVLTMLVVQHLLGACAIICIVRFVLSVCPTLNIDTITENTSPKRKEKQNDTFGERRQGIARQHMITAALFDDLPTRTKLVMASYALLYFTILSPGAMLNAWLLNGLNKIQMNEMTIAGFGAASQFCGALATFVSPILLRRSSSIYVAGAVAQWCQSLLVVGGVVCFWIAGAVMAENDEWQERFIMGFLICIGLSRVGLWTFDLVERQILQQSVPRKHQTVLFNAERGVTQLVSLGMMYLCYVYPEPKDFGLLVSCSLVAVCLSSALLAFQFYCN